MSSAGNVRVEPYTITVAEEVLIDLSSRLARTRWPAPLPATAWAAGTELGYLRIWRAPDDGPPLDADERAFIERRDRWIAEEGAYAAMQSTRPQTLAYGLTDSPVGLAGWMIEKFRAWSDCRGVVEDRFSKDELLTTITIYWVTGTIGSSFLPYFGA
jgi:hypothetical protein